MRFYPEITEDFEHTLEILLSNMEDDPEGYLNDPECHFSPKMLEMLEKLVSEGGFGGKEGVSGSKLSNFDSVSEFLEEETTALYQKLKETEVNLGPKDNAETMSYFRTATSLLEKLITMQERTLGLKRMHEFQNAILGYMDEVLEPGQRTEFRNRIKSHLANGDQET